MKKNIDLFHDIQFFLDVPVQCFVLREVDELDKSLYWILAFACTVALNCQNTSQNASNGCEKQNFFYLIRILS